jgi:hypothetical protein
MPKTERRPNRTDSCKMWEGRLVRSNKVYDRWEERYECQRLDDYYEGKQWRGMSEDEAKQKYVINMVFATVETQLPTLMFSKPKIKTEARPDHEETAQSQAGDRATLIEQTLQTQIDNPAMHFGFETTLSLRDAYSRFAIVEVGYSADWIENPNAGKPVLDDENKPQFDPDRPKKPLVEEKYALKPGTKESLYIKRLDPAHFRASPGHNNIHMNDWVAHYDWVPIEDVRNNPSYGNRARGLQATGSLSPTDNDAEGDTYEKDESEVQARAGMVKLWTIHDLRAKAKHVYAEGHTTLLVEDKPYKTLPYSVMKFFERRNAFYPQPPIYNWLGPQDEINETREMQKVHRRRALRRYLYEGEMDPKELEKLETGPDMVAVKVPRVNPPMMVPLQDAPLHPSSTTEELAVTQNDLNIIAGVTGEQRNQPTSPTATQANIMNARSQVRESHARSIVALWLADIALVMLLTMREKMRLEFMVKRSVDPFSAPADPKQVQDKAKLWQEISAEDIDDLDVDISIDVSTLSPVAQEAQRNSWMIVLQLMTNPQLAAFLFTPRDEAPNDPSPMLRKTLMLNEITSEQEIREIWRVGQAVMRQAAESAKAQAAIAKTPDPLRLSLAIKAEDMAQFPLAKAVLEQYLIASMTSEHALQAAQVMQPESPLNGGGGGGLTIPGQPGGAPAGVPAGMGG